MFCPQCRTEYREGFFECADCGVALVETLPEPLPQRAVEWVTVLETGNDAVVALAKTILDDAGIEYAVKNEFTQGLLGRIGTGSNPAFGLMHIQVDRGDAAEARALLAEIEQ